MISFAPAGEGMQGPSARLDEGGYLNVHPQEPVEMKGMLCHGDACKLDRWVRISIFDAVYSERACEGLNMIVHLTHSHEVASETIGCLSK